MTRLAFIMLLSAAVLSACGTATPRKDLALEQVRRSLEQFKADPELSQLAPLALGDAERALRQAEQAGNDDTLRAHLIYMADRRIQIARAVAQEAQLDEQLIELRERRQELLVTASQMQARQAREEAERARLLSAATAEDAERARMEAMTATEQQQQASQAASQALAEAEQARRLADAQSRQAELARREANLASEQAATYRRQLETLQLRQTESGVVLTLGDVLFETGQAELVADAQANLAEVVDLVQGEPDKKIRIEGHTDSVGSASSNLDLSTRRAESVRQALASLGVSAERMTVLGLGEDFPIASNETEDGRSQNRRVDVILLDQNN